ncbi:hypothetical protein L6R53_13540 [Myxococcota bacterium]|nr:hypothetical protein [Myxococcota bacterium]
MIGNGVLLLGMVLGCGGSEPAAPAGTAAPAVGFAAPAVGFAAPAVGFALAFSSRVDGEIEPCG